MTTTDQQAVTVAQDITRNPASIWLSPICDDTAHHGEGRTWAAPAPAETCEDCSKPWVEYVRSDLASVSSASAEASVREAFLGVMRGEVVNEGAWSLHLHFGRGDGARDRMRAASSLLGSIVTAPPTPSATTSQEGKWVTVPREPTQDQLIAGNGMFHTGEVPLNIYRAMLAASPEPVPATNQAGEVGHYESDRLKIARALGERFIARGNARVTGSGYKSYDEMPYSYTVDFLADAEAVLTALATQPATSQEGEACVCGGAYTMCEDGHAVNCPASNQRAAYLAMTAATPTPPTLSEDLREAAGALIQRMADRETDRGGCLDITAWLMEADRIAALAQVKAS